MDSNTTEIIFEFPPHLRVYKDGRVERRQYSEFVAPSDNPENTVRSKDVTVKPETDVSVRIFIPKLANTRQKLPLLIYIHGGAFCIGSALSRTYHNYASSIVEKANVVLVSVEYRLAPEHPIPAGYDDSWEAFQWAVSHAEGNSKHEPWLNDYADFQRVYLGGDSAGANIASDLAIRAGVSELHDVKIMGLLLVHPFFGNNEVDKLYKQFCPSSSGRDDDPRLNPAVDPRLPSMPCKRVLVCLAEKDFLRERGSTYCEALKQSAWTGEVEVTETEGEEHVFHLTKPDCEKAAALIGCLATFLNKA